jgi:eukaryotic-like serine/threonine-protein kinase
MSATNPPGRLRPFRPVPFGRYTLLSPLAMGGMGELYLGRLEGAQGFEKLCAIKKILPSLVEEPTFVERFVDEARILVKLSHGSIAQVLDMGVHQGEPYIALEYVDGKDLRKVIARANDAGTRLPLTFCLYVMGCVLEALAYAHRKRDEEDRELNLVHRDVSPANILVSYEGEVKVIDFGLAKSALGAARTHPSMILGKFRYMAPEQARHQRVDRRADIYAAGLCLYELLTGQSPFEGVPPHELMARVSQPELPPMQQALAHCPPQLVELLGRALQADPSQRLGSAEEFRRGIALALNELEPSGGPQAAASHMREAFAHEYQQERRLLASLRGGTLPVLPSAPGLTGTDHTAVVSLRDLAPADPGPVPLSFEPTPRTAEATDHDHDAETRSGAANAEQTAVVARALLEPGPEPPRSDTQPRIDLSALADELHLLEQEPQTDFAPQVEGPVPQGGGLPWGPQTELAVETVEDPRADIAVAGGPVTAENELVRRTVTYTVLRAVAGTVVVGTAALLMYWATRGVDEARRTMEQPAVASGPAAADAVHPLVLLLEPPIATAQAQPPQPAARTDPDEAEPAEEPEDPDDAAEVALTALIEELKAESAVPERGVRKKAPPPSPALKALRAEWTRAEVPFKQLRRQHGCEAARMRLLCAQARMISTELADLRPTDTERMAELRGFIATFRADVKRLSESGR